MSIDLYDDVPFLLQTVWHSKLSVADLLQVMEPTWFEVIYKNLFTEVNRSREVKFDAFCSGQYKFLNDAEFYSRNPTIF